MANFMFILKFFGGLIILTALGGMVGYILKLDKNKYLDDNKNAYREDNQQEDNL